MTTPVTLAKKQKKTGEFTALSKRNKLMNTDTDI